MNFPDVDSVLQIEPEVGAHRKGGAELYRKLWRDGSARFDDSIDRFGIDTNVIRKRLLRESKRS